MLPAGQISWQNKTMAAGIAFAYYYYYYYFTVEDRSLAFDLCPIYE
jgi:hypothetical protein